MHVSTEAALTSPCFIVLARFRRRLCDVSTVSHAMLTPSIWPSVKKAPWPNASSTAIVRMPLSTSRMPWYATKPAFSSINDLVVRVVIQRWQRFIERALVLRRHQWCCYKYETRHRPVMSSLSPLHFPLSSKHLFAEHRDGSLTILTSDISPWTLPSEVMTSTCPSSAR